MKRVCPYDQITPVSIMGCHECGFRLICAEYEKQLKAAWLYIRMGNSARFYGKRVMAQDLCDIYNNKVKMICGSLWHWTSNEELLKDIVTQEVRYL